jgi:hypothetical protein
MRMFDFSSWNSILATLLGLALVTLIGVGIRLLVMTTVQQRRERMNRQINERLRTLIAAYKALGGSFTGDLSVDPTHLRQLRRAAPGSEAPPIDLAPDADGDSPGAERRRRIRDSVEASLSDIILLGTDEQVRLAAQAAADLAAGRPVHTHALVVSLRTFIREALDLDPIPADLAIPPQGPARPAPSGGKGGARENAREGGGRGGGGGGGGAAGLAGGAGMGAGLALGLPDSPRD